MASETMSQEALFERSGGATSAETTQETSSEILLSDFNSHNMQQQEQHAHEGAPPGDADANSFGNIWGGALLLDDSLDDVIAKRDEEDTSSLGGNSDAD
eukprot:scaffold1955_cov269-Prasinococcus_capsulatus_cf.AAC.3